MRLIYVNDCNIKTINLMIRVKNVVAILLEKNGQRENPNIFFN